MILPYEPIGAKDLFLDLQDQGVSAKEAAALASALMVSNALIDVANALLRLGLADACTPKGAIEVLAEEVKGLAEKL